MKYLLQIGDICASEKRAVKKHTSEIFASTFEDLSNIKEECIPIGSVEFCSQYLHLKNIPIPKHISYPDSLLLFLKREIKQDLFGNVPPGLFVKPVEQIKLFTGHVKGESTEALPEGLEKILVWVCESVNFLAEWRFYILDGKILGYSRYDDSDEEYPEPDMTIIQSVIDAFVDSPIAYALDFGLLNNGDFVLIEVNDAWALGLYGWGNMTDEKYVDMITQRWKEIINPQE